MVPNIKLLPNTLVIQTNLLNKSYKNYFKVVLHRLKPVTLNYTVPMPFLYSRLSAVQLSGKTIIYTLPFLRNHTSLGENNTKIYLIVFKFIALIQTGRLDRGYPFILDSYIKIMFGLSCS